MVASPSDNPWWPKKLTFLNDGFKTPEKNSAQEIWLADHDASVSELAWVISGKFQSNIWHCRSDSFLKITDRNFVNVLLKSKFQTKPGSSR